MRVLKDKLFIPFFSIYLIVNVFIPTTLNGQIQWCGTDTTSLSFNLPDIQTRLETRSTFTVPLVVHIVWNKNEENLSDSQIHRQIQRLNFDFNYTPQSLPYIPKEFRNAIGYPTIKFCLASIDPEGKPSTGITRTQTSILNIGTTRDAQNQNIIHYTTAGGKSAWDTEKYINIWVGKLENLYGRSSIGGSVSKKLEDGIVIDPSVFKANPLYNLSGRTLIHEMGHYFGLKHLWGQQVGDCTEDDELHDTPIQSAPFFGCPKYPQKSCGISNMFMNFMDFVDDGCMHFFTKDQVAKMENILMTNRGGLINSMASACFKDVPSPALSTFKVSYNKDYIHLISPTNLNAPVQYLFCNTLGQTIYRNQLYILNQSEIFIKDFPTGIYFLYLRYNKEHRVFKFLKS